MRLGLPKDLAFLLNTVMLVKIKNIKALEADIEFIELNPCLVIQLYVWCVGR